MDITGTFFEILFLLSGFWGGYMLGQIRMIDQWKKTGDPRGPFKVNKK